MNSSEHLIYEINPRAFDKFPLDWNNLFKRDAPLAVEIGCGNGEFITNWCRDQPDWNLVGIDFALKSIERAQARLFSHDMQNVLLIRDDAQFALRELFEENSLLKVVLNYPDPWPKEKHRDRRLVNSEFVRILSRVLILEGNFSLVTDQEWYAIQAESIFAESGFFRIEKIKKTFKNQISTKYERRWFEQGIESHIFCAYKRDNSRITTILKDTQMPHSFVENEIKPEQLYGLKDVVGKKEDNVFNIKSVYSDRDNKTFLLKTVCSDRGYKQNVFIIVAKHPRGYIVKLDGGSLSYRTPAVKMAVKEIGRLLSKE
jgi:tRNA (guanine-N7-)-methyltransferase